MDWTALFTIICLLVVFSLGLYYRAEREKLKKEIDCLKSDIAHLEKLKKLALQQSRSTIKGQLSEQIYPLSIDCPYELSDMKFLGQPFDYLVLRGYSEEAITEVIFVEVKTGRSRLSPIQRSLRDCIANGNVSWQTVTIKEFDHDREVRGAS